MAIIDQEISMFHGEARGLDFTMTPVEDITGWTIAFTVTRALQTADKLIGPVVATVVSGPDGTFTVDLASADTQLIPDTYGYDVWRTDPGGERLLAIGDFIITGQVRLPTA